jgi:uncharacterized protein YndB with AHSA1/START domain
MAKRDRPPAYPHWTVADREAHEKMGFYQGWGQCADQLAPLVTKS